MIICEIGLNHMGDEDRAIQMIKKINTSEADAISFQIREPKFYIDNPEYLLPKGFYKYAKDVVNSSGKYFGLSVCDDSYEDYTGECNVDFYKVLSWAISDYKLVKMLSLKGSLCTYLSTGMSDYSELDKLTKRYKNIQGNLSLVHTQLSFSIDDVNLLAITKMRSRYNMPISYGHHCENISVLYLSVAFLSDSIFFYVKLNDDIANPDDKHAVNLNRIESVIHKLKLLPKAIGNMNKIKMKNQVEGVK